MTDWFPRLGFLKLFFMSCEIAEQKQTKKAFYSKLVQKTALADQGGALLMVYQYPLAGEPINYFSFTPLCFQLSAWKGKEGEKEI